MHSRGSTALICEREIGHVMAVRGARGLGLYDGGGEGVAPLICWAEFF